MRSLLIILLVLVVFIGGVVFLFTRLAEPKAAEAFTPLKWQQIALGQTKTALYDYLGTPQQVQTAGDTWTSTVNDAKKYVLTTRYRGDTLLIGYTITFHATAFGMERITHVKTDSLP